MLKNHLCITCLHLPRSQSYLALHIFFFKKNLVIIVSQLLIIRIQKSLGEVVLRGPSSIETIISRKSLISVIRQAVIVISQVLLLLLLIFICLSIHPNKNFPTLCNRLQLYFT